MNHHWSSQGRGKEIIQLTNITYNSTCIDLDLLFLLQCDVCSQKSDIHTKNLSALHKQFCDTAFCNCCKQPCASVNGPSTKNKATNKKLCRVQEYLKIETDLEIQHFCAYTVLTKKTKAKNEQSSTHEKQQSPPLKIKKMGQKVMKK